MTRIKICGITNYDDAVLAIESGADALGFIGVPDSPRYVSPHDAQNIVKRLPPFTTTVAVVRRAADASVYPCDHIQYYTGGPLENVHCYKAIRVRNARDLQQISAEHRNSSAILLDTFHEDLLGGSGQTFDWALALQAKSFTNAAIILAGGLNQDNVTEACTTVHPYAVDIASGTESSPGRKDRFKVMEFVQAVRAFDFERDRIVNLPIR